MPFEPLETETKGNSPVEAIVTYMRPKPRGKAAYADKGQSGRPVLRICIPTKICGIGKAEKHKLFIGTGDDAGKMRVAGNTAEDSIAPKQLKHTFIWTFGYVPRLGEEVFDERLPVRKIEDDVFEIDVNPKWFNAATVHTLPKLPQRDPVPAPYVPKKDKQGGRR
jgi:hypothetical protein